MAHFYPLKPAHFRLLWLLAEVTNLTPGLGALLGGSVILSLLDASC